MSADGYVAPGFQRVRDAFGHPGRGGSLGFADPDSGVAFGYVVSHIRQDLNDTRAAALVAAVNASLR